MTLILSGIFVAKGRLFILKDPCRFGQPSKGLWRVSAGGNAAALVVSITNQ